MARKPVPTSTRAALGGAVLLLLTAGLLPWESAADPQGRQGTSASPPPSGGFKRPSSKPWLDPPSGRTTARDKDSEVDPEVTFEGAVVRLLPPQQRRIEGKVEVEALTIDPAIAELVFFVDGERAARSNRPPWSAKIRLASPPREQTVTVKAYDGRGEELGEDAVVLNRLPRPLRARVTALDRNGGRVAVEAEVSVPRNASLDRVEIYLGDALTRTLAPADLEGDPQAGLVRLAVELANGADADFLRVVASLEDGRAVEDVEVIGAPGLTDQVDVQLVQLQTLVTLKNGAVVTDLDRDSFQVFERGEARAVDRIFPAQGVALSLGLVLDTSGSMAGIWRQAIGAAKQFLEQSVTSRDSAFLVDFDNHVRLVQPLTSDLQQLYQGLDGLRPEGSTALFDAVLFSLLQFEQVPGRRALVVVTDGYDFGSSSNPKNVVEFARKLGVPVYVVALEGPGQGPRSTLSTNNQTLSRTAPVHSLKLLADPSGGRLIRAGRGAGLERAFLQINRELRNQYVLTYYSEVPLGEHDLDDVEVRVSEPKGAQVRTLLALDQVN